jgi:cysteinyl-tRNA synthetase
MSVALRITSTLSGQKEIFEAPDGPVRMYVCGMTPKFHPHVGHARFSVTADVIRRYLEYRGLEVKHVQNFTDVDDKIIARAQREGKTPEEVARTYSDSYFELLDCLNVKRAHVYPAVTQSMPAIVDYVQGLIERGYGYVLDGDVYFEVAKFEPYGQLSGRTEDGAEPRSAGQMVGVRTELEPGKRDPRDFALWKAAKPGEPSWPSPWGAGRPGWHIECSAMIRETLGDRIDIHGGGRDLIFPHHENELAQTEAYTDRRPAVRYWAHNGLVMAGSEKMAHSLENFTTVQDVIERFDPMALRYFLLQTHYRMPISYNPEVLPSAERALARMRGALEGYAPGTVPPEAPAYVRKAREAFEQAMDDDFNTSGALGALFDLVREINRRRDAGTPKDDVAAGQSTLVELAGVLGLTLEAPPQDRAAGDIGPLVELLLATRQRLREAKQWALADEIRNGLRDLGIAVEDRPDGAIWRRETPPSR